MQFIVAELAKNFGVPVVVAELAKSFGVSIVSLSIHNLDSFGCQMVAAM